MVDPVEHSNAFCETVLKEEIICIEWEQCYRYLNFSVDPMNTAGHVFRKIAVALLLALMRENGDTEHLVHGMKNRADDIHNSNRYRFGSSFTPEHERFITELIDVLDEILLEIRDAS